MGQVAELIAEFSARFRPIRPPYDAAEIRAFEATIRDFRLAVKRLENAEEELGHGLRGLLTDRDSIRILLWIQAADARPSAGLVEPLCDVLSVRDGYVQHEWVAEILGEIGDPRAIPALRDCCAFDVGGDPFRSLPKRCLEALAAIGTPEAIAAIREQLASPWIELREEAAEWLFGDGESDTPDIR